MRALVLVLLLAACAPPPTPRNKAPAPPALAGTRWVMVIEAARADAPTLQFGDSSRAGGFTGCNAWFAQANSREDGLRFEAIGITRRACDESAMEIERDFSDVLERTRGAVVNDGVLTLTGEDGAALARFAPAS